MTILMDAAGRNNHVLIEILLDAGADIEAVVGDDAVTPLQNAAILGRLEAARTLISRGANIEARTVKTKRTPLLDAVIGEGFDVANELIMAGADVDAVDAKGWNAVMWAARKGNCRLLHLLKAAGSQMDYAVKGVTALHIAAESGHVEAITTLLKWKAVEIDAKAANGRTPLQCAISKRKIEAVQALIAAGANVTALFSDKTFSADLAAAMGLDALIML
jgi:ankyrin repeat protein